MSMLRVFLFLPLISLARFDIEEKVVEKEDNLQWDTPTRAQKLTQEEIEQQFLEMRSELRQQRKINEAQNRMIKSLNDKIVQLQQENDQKEVVTSALGVGQTEKRSDDLGSLESVMSQTTQKVDLLTADVQALKNAEQTLTNVNSQQDQALKDALAAQDQARGTTYTRWGHASCPNGTDMVYSGIIGGSIYTNQGSPANYLCMAPAPRFDGHPVPSGFTPNTLYGSEYQTGPEPEVDTTPVCAVCRVPRAASIMIPGSFTCSPGWQPEYTGHLMAGYGGGPASSEYICVDSSHAYLPGSQVSNDQNLVYYVIAKCGGLPCPPYEDGKIVTCVVCTK